MTHVLAKRFSIPVPVIIALLISGCAVESTQVNQEFAKSLQVFKGVGNLIDVNAQHDVAKMLPTRAAVDYLTDLSATSRPTYFSTCKFEESGVSSNDRDPYKYGWEDFNLSAYAEFGMVSSYAKYEADTELGRKGYFYSVMVSNYDSDLDQTGKLCLAYYVDGLETTDNPEVLQTIDKVITALVSLGADKFY